MFCKILAILGHFWTLKVLFQVEEALKHLFAGSNNFEYMFFCVRHLQSRVGRACTGHPSPKDNVFLPKIGGLRLFLGEKRAMFRGSGPETPIF